MAKLILPKTDTATREANTPVAGEILYDYQEKAFYGGDGSTAGGVPFKSYAPNTVYVYGLDYDRTADTCARVELQNNQEYAVVNNFPKMPAHNWKRCVMSSLGGRSIQYYLHPDDSTKKEDGTAAVIDGTDGEVMVEIQITYYRIDRYTDNNLHEHIVWLVSNQRFPGSIAHPFFYTSADGDSARIQYVGAFNGVLCDSAGAPLTAAGNTPPGWAAGQGYKLRSIAVDYRPVTSIVRAQARAGAVNAGGTLTNVSFYWYLGMMMAIEAGSLNTQSLSTGFTDISNTGLIDYSWLRYPGRTAGLGNHSGSIIANAEESDNNVLPWRTNSDKVVAFSYRGIENPFGGIYDGADGCQLYRGVAGSTRSGFWFTNATSLYTGADSQKGLGPAAGKFPEAGFTGANWQWIEHPFMGSELTECYIGTEFDPLTFLPLAQAADGSASTGLCDKAFIEGSNLDASGRIMAYGGSCGEISSSYAGCFFVTGNIGIGQGFSKCGFRIAC